MKRNQKAVPLTILSFVHIILLVALLLTSQDLANSPAPSKKSPDGGRPEKLNVASVNVAGLKVRILEKLDDAKKKVKLKRRAVDGDWDIDGDWDVDGPTWTTAATEVPPSLQADQQSGQNEQSPSQPQSDGTGGLMQRDFFDSIKDKGDELIKDGKEKINDAKDDVKDKVNDVVGSFFDKLKKAVEDVFEKIPDTATYHFDAFCTSHFQDYTKPTKGLESRDCISFRDTFDVANKIFGGATDAMRKATSIIPSEISGEFLKAVGVDKNLDELLTLDKKTKENLDQVPKALEKLKKLVLGGTGACYASLAGSVLLLAWTWLFYARQSRSFVGYVLFCFALSLVFGSDFTLFLGSTLLTVAFAQVAGLLNGISDKINKPTGIELATTVDNFENFRRQMLLSLAIFAIAVVLMLYLVVFDCCKSRKRRAK